MPVQRRRPITAPRRGISAPTVANAKVKSWLSRMAKKDLPALKRITRRMK